MKKLVIAIDFDGTIVTSDEIEEKIEEVAYCNVAIKFICLFAGIIIGYCLGVMCV